MADREIANMEGKDFRHLVDIIAFLPQFATHLSRRQLIEDALRDFPNARRLAISIDFQGDADVVTGEMIRRLITFGQVERDREALGQVLEYVLTTYLGESTDASFLRGLIDRYHMLPATARSGTEGDTGALPSAVANGKCYIFISYARQNVDAASKVQHALQQAGYAVFRDGKDIQVGSDWVNTIDKALRESTHLVLLLSNYSMPYRKEVQNEWFYFDLHDKPILPLYLEDCVLHSRLESKNWIDARHDLDAAISQLLIQLSDSC